MKNEQLMEKIVSLCKRRGFVFPGSEIYGGLANSWDYGPYGTELINNIRNHWWDFFVKRRPDMVGLESTIIMHPKVWEASGHVEGFHDPLVEDKVTHKRYRVDHLLEDHGVDVAGMKLDDMWNVIQKKKIKSPDGNELTKPKQFNLMFKTHIGPTEDHTSLAYLRPETAQGMFVDFREVLQTARKKIPFGIAQSGKCFRNEITPGQFIFRLREFNLMEFEYFIAPEGWEEIFEMWVGEMKKYQPNWGSIRMIWSGTRFPKKTGRIIPSGRLILSTNFRLGSKSFMRLPIALTTTFRRMKKFSGRDMSYTDPVSGEKFVPHVIEPTFGIDRTFFAVICASLP